MCFCYVQRRMSTHKQSNVQTNRRHPTPEYLSSPNKSRWGQFFVGIPRIIPMTPPVSAETAAINGYVGINGFTLRNVHNVRTSRIILDETQRFVSACACSVFFFAFCFCYIFIFVLFTRVLNKAFIHSVFGRKKQRLIEQSNARFLNARVHEYTASVFFQHRSCRMTWRTHLHLHPGPRPRTVSSDQHCCTIAQRISSFLQSCVTQQRQEF